jgi:photosystem II stability/assembly factor-like uncharacterized protein
VVRTADGGRNWTVVLDYPVDAVDFHDAQQAWAVTEKSGFQTSSGWQATVKRTSDGGATWTTIGTAEGGGQVSAVQFVDAAHGWIFATPSAGGAGYSQDTSLLRTTDGGRSWSRVVDVGHSYPNAAATIPASCTGGGSVNSPVFADAMNGWLGAFCDHVFFYATHDGGMSWAPQALPAFPGPSWGGGGAFPISYLTSSMHFTSAQSGRFLLSRGQTTGANALQEQALYTTGDSGATWQATRMPAAAVELSFTDASHAWMIGAGDGGNIEAVSLYASVDGARTWRRLLGPTTTDPASPLEFLKGAEMDFVDPATGFILSPFTAPPMMYRTDDAGRSWAAVPMQLP